MGLRVFNTLGRRMEAFEPLEPPRVGMYVCGPTVWGHSHLGHAKSYISFDVIVRWLRHSGYLVNYVQNITDVGHLTDDADAGEDKVVAESRRRGLHPMAVVELYLRSYLEDMDALNIARPDIMPRAAAHIPEQIACAQALLARGHAYEANGSVYFSVASKPDYGKLSGRTVAELEAGARVAVHDDKRHPADFALWKRAEPGHIMRWPSPWGEGYPGWHLECSVMSQKYIGTTLDIHGGGLENQFPHHECEIAQAEAATGQCFVRYWLHNNMCTLNGQKMGKSLGNAISLKQIFAEGHPLLEQTLEPAVVRHFVLTSHYRAPLDFSNEALRATETGSYKLRDTLAELTRAAARAASATPRATIRTALDQTRTRFAEAMNDDFNTAAALAGVFELARQVGGWAREGAGREDLLAAEALLHTLTGNVLGLRWHATEAGTSGERDALIQLLVEVRKEARTAKNFALSDLIRDRLRTLDVELKDGPHGTTW
ncbi:MAG: cysteine--tRNA ligase [Phycisphaerales bacterium]|nr:cysteine--tRNA ligase [Phycisphaerales bacterium]